MDKRQQAFEIVQQLSQEDLDTVVEEKGEKLQETTPSLFGALASKKKLTDRDFQKAKKSIVKDIDLGKKIKKPH